MKWLVVRTGDDGHYVCRCMLCRQACECFDFAGEGSGKTRNVSQRSRGVLFVPDCRANAASIRMSFVAVVAENSTVRSYPVLRTLQTYGRIISSYANWETNRILHSAAKSPVTEQDRVT